MEKAPTSIKAFSKSIWKLPPVSNRIRAFAWRACKNILPIKANLFHRHVTQHANCDECGLEAETSGHLFWHCERAKAVWSAMGLATMDRVTEFMDLVGYARNVKQMADHSLASMITRTWRNSVGVQLPRLLDELGLPGGVSNKKSQAPTLSASTNYRLVFSSPTIWYKINVDGGNF